MMKQTLSIIFIIAFLFVLGCNKSSSTNGANRSGGQELSEELINHKLEFLNTNIEAAKNADDDQSKKRYCDTAKKFADELTGVDRENVKNAIAEYKRVCGK